MSGWKLWEGGNIRVRIVRRGSRGLGWFDVRVVCVTMTVSWLFVKGDTDGSDRSKSKGQLAVYGCDSERKVG